jgi:molecular chaperone GrpE (heat shock protein)
MRRRRALRAALAVAEPPYTFPAGVADADEGAELDRLLVRCARAQDELAAARDGADEEQRRLLLGLLDVQDALDRMAAADADPARARRAVEATRRLLGRRLAAAGVVPLALRGKIADPSVADVDDYEPFPELPDETVIRELVVGYLWNGDVLRRARVTVAAADPTVPAPAD